MLAPMSGKAKPSHQAKSTQSFADKIRREFSLLIGGLRHREQYYNLQGVNSYLNVIMTLAVLGLVLPNFTTTTGGPTFSTEQQIFLIVVALFLYAIFLVIQTMRHRGYFMESEQ